MAEASLSLDTGIYEIVNTVNGASYIGSAVNFKKRWATHRNDLRKGCHHNIMLQRAWAKYGADAFKFGAIFHCQKADLISFEQKFLDELRPAYNVCRVAGSCLGVRHSDEANRKKGRAPGVPLSPDHRERIAAAVRGNKCALGFTRSAETREKIAAAFRGKPLAAEHRAKLAAAHIGKKASIETRAKMSAAGRANPSALGRNPSSETRLKMSKAKVGKPWTAAQRAARLRVLDET